MLPDRVSNPGPLTYESGALPIALRGPAIKCPDSGIQVGSVLPNFICAVATTFDATFFCRKKTTKFTYTFLKSSVFVINKIQDLTNSNDMHFFF